MNIRTSPCDSSEADSETSSLAPWTKAERAKNINAKAFFLLSSRWSHWAPLLTNSYFSSATLRFSFQKRRNIRIIESNIHRPFAALRFFSICAERLFKKNELYSFHFPSAVFSFCLYLSHVFHGAVAVRHDKLNQGYRTKHFGAPIYSATSEEEFTREGELDKKEPGVFFFVFFFYCDLPCSMRNHCALACACMLSLLGPFHI